MQKMDFVFMKKEVKFIIRKWEYSGIIALKYVSIQIDNKLAEFLICYRPITT